MFQNCGQLQFVKYTATSIEAHRLNKAGFAPQTTNNQEMTDSVQQMAYMSDGTSEAGEPGRQPASLLTIPQELRDEIFKYLLQPGRSISINLFPYDEATRAFLLLSRTCKQTRAEAIDLFYFNTFVWAICSLPHYTCQLQLHRMKRIELILESKLVCSITLSDNEFTIYFNQHISTLSIMSTTAGQVRMYPYDQRPLPGFELDFQRQYAMMEEVHHLLVQGSGMTISALRVLGDELWDDGQYYSA